MNKKLSLCFIAHNAYGVLANVDTGHAGGIEVQVPMIAKWFAKQGYEVSMITWDHGFADGVAIDGVTVRKLCRKDAGVPVVRFIWPRWTSYYSALSRANADVYISSCADMSLGQLAFWAKMNKRQVVQNISSEVDCTHELSNVTASRDRLLYQYGLRRADLIVTQTEKQSELLRREYQLESSVVPMASAGFTGSLEAQSGSARLNKPRILWVGRLSREKRLEWLLEVAKFNPGWQFDVVGAANETTEYSRELMETAGSLDNVNMVGRVPHSEMGSLYSAASVLCCTSVYEGFPNVFLEAWSVGLPIVTTFDPDNLVESHGLGAAAESVQIVEEKIAELLVPEAWEQASSRAKHFFADRHQIDAALARLETALLTLA